MVALPFCSSPVPPATYAAYPSTIPPRKQRRLQSTVECLKKGYCVHESWSISRYRATMLRAPRVGSPGSRSKRSRSSRIKSRQVFLLSRIIACLAAWAFRCIREGRLTGFSSSVYHHTITSSRATHKDRQTQQPPELRLSYPCFRVNEGIEGRGKASIGGDGGI